MNDGAYLAHPSWGDLFGASTGAAAALTGLMFVALSLNVREILDRGGIAERAAAAVLELLGITIASLAALMPQASTPLGIELITIGSGLGAAVGVLLVLSIRRRPRGDPRHLPSALACIGPGPICLVVGGVSLCLRSGGGLHWTVAGIALTLLGGVVTAWILLVEILR